MGFITAVRMALGIGDEEQHPTEAIPLSGGEASSPPPTRRRQSRVIKFPHPRDNKSIYTMQPTSYDDAVIAADYLKAGFAVFVNLQTIDAPLGRRLVDVLSGVCYGVEGRSHKVGDRLFLFLPHDFYIASEDKSHLEAQGLFLHGFRESSRSLGSGRLEREKSASLPLERGGLFSCNS